MSLATAPRAGWYSGGVKSGNCAGRRECMHGFFCLAVICITEYAALELVFELNQCTPASLYLNDSTSFVLVWQWVCLRHWCRAEEFHFTRTCTYVTMKSVRRTQHAVCRWSRSSHSRHTQSICSTMTFRVFTHSIIRLHTFEVMSWHYWRRSYDLAGVSRTFKIDY